ncbi:alpha/beta-hydrolase [Mollisia scopiformis]|uniref:Alpha/beta-hydrolase n=1 Tax=Mollisia scopiformis TaxID=149040 RepID=A0A194XNR1_MOLSC|nr:alpha/beta-hydrolase [Mollisia scopiformis]KUJ21749.1 alpha/beta-hydrolase [Mollisia scopiformis]
MANSLDATAPVYLRHFSFFQRLYYGIRIRVMKSLATAFFSLFRLPGVRDNSILPTYTTVYPCQPKLTNRVFFPKSYKPDDAPLPLYLDIHGGGFALMSPCVDDWFCTEFCNDNKLLVISLDYPKTPAHPYPAGVQAIADLVDAILKDESLPFDRKKVAIGGFSAGATLSLAAPQDARLKGKIGGVAAFYPPTNWTTSIDWKLSTRPKDAGPDGLKSQAGMFDYAYFKPDQNLKDPQASVAFASRESLPPKLCIVGCEFDMLCRDSELMAESLAKVGNGPRTGTDTAWEQNGVRWEKVLKEVHGFDLIPARGEEKARTKARGKKMHQDAAEFLLREVYV